MSIRYRQVLFSYFSWFIIINGKLLEFWNQNHLNIEIAAIFGDYRCFEEICYVHAFSIPSNINSHIHNHLKYRGRILSEQ